MQNIGLEKESTMITGKPVLVLTLVGAVGFPSALGAEDRPTRENAEIP